MRFCRSPVMQKRTFPPCPILPFPPLWGFFFCKLLELQSFTHALSMCFKLSLFHSVTSQFSRYIFLSALTWRRSKLKVTFTERWAKGAFFLFDYYFPFDYNELLSLRLFWKSSAVWTHTVGYWEHLVHQPQSKTHVHTDSEGNITKIISMVQ